jgi:hypothetical protein
MLFVCLIYYWQYWGLNSGPHNWLGRPNTTWAMPVASFFCFSVFFFFFFSDRVLSFFQGLASYLCLLAEIIDPPSMLVEMGVSPTFSPSCPQTMILLISTSWGAEITGMHHQAWLFDFHEAFLSKYLNEDSSQSQLYESWKGRLAMELWCPGWQ